MPEDLRVVVVRGESLLEQGVLQALLRLPGLEVEVVPGSAADLVAALRSFRPHAVIADEMDRGFINDILACSPGTVVVTLNLREPTVAVYHSRIAEVASVQELVDQLRLERARTSMGLETAAAVGGEGSTASDGCP